MEEKIEQLRKYKLLFVDDEENIQKILSNIFKNIDANFLVAKDGKEAIELLQNNSDVDFIITDINMPNVNGFELIRAIKEKYENIQFLILSAHSETGYIREANDLRIKNYLVKPLDIIKLINAIVE